MKALLLATICFSCLSCDVPKRLLIKNDSGKALVIMLPKSGKEPFFHDTISAIQIEAKSQYLAFYGFGGNWTKSDPGKFYELLKQSKIFTGTDSLPNGKQLKIKRRGLLKKVLLVSVKQKGPG